MLEIKDDGLKPEVETTLSIYQCKSTRYYKPIMADSNLLFTESYYIVEHRTNLYTYLSHISVIQLTVYH